MSTLKKKSENYHRRISTVKDISLIVNNLLDEGKFCRAYRDSQWVSNA